MRANPRAKLASLRSKIIMNKFVLSRVRSSVIVVSEIYDFPSNAIVDKNSKFESDTEGTKFAGGLVTLAFYYNIYACAFRDNLLFEPSSLEYFIPRK